MTYADTIRSLAATTEGRARDLHTVWEAGRISDDEFEALLAALVVGANGRASAVADLSLAAAVTVALRRPVPPLGIVPAPTEPARLRTATRTLRTALEAMKVSGLPAGAPRPDPAARVGRLARAEPLTTAAKSYSEGMAKSEHVTGWVRGLSATACQLCRWWARDGRVWPADHRMPTHKGCSCSPIPTVRERIKPVVR